MLDVRLVSFGHACLSPSLRKGLRLDVRLVSLSCAFLPSLREEIRLEFRLVSLCHTRFSSSIRKKLRLDVRLFFPTRVSLLPYERDLG